MTFRKIPRDVHEDARDATRALMGTLEFSKSRNERKKVEMRLKIVRVNDKMQRGYRYALTAPIGRNFDPEVRPELTPKEMLALGVFCGKYMTDCRKEFPASWFKKARLSPDRRRAGTAAGT